MQEQKEVQKQNSPKKNVDFVKWFSELNKDSGKVAGGKGASLGEMYNAKFPVPPGFVVTAQAYQYFIEKANIDKKLREILSGIDYEDTKQLTEATKEIREIILKSSLPKKMEEEIVEAYEALDVDHFNPETDSNAALDILKKSSSDGIFVAVRSSATTEDLADASFAGQQDSFVNVKGHSSLILHIKKCFASLFTARATYYRNKKGFKYDDAQLAVVVQKMVDSLKSGVMFSQDPTFNNDNIIIEAVYGLGEGIVSGRITPDKYVLNQELKILDEKIADKKIAITRDSGGNKEIVKLSPKRSKAKVLSDYELKILAEHAKNLEEHYQHPQDIEFAIEGEEIYIVQSRPVTTIGKRINPEDNKQIKGEAILSGLGTSPGIGVGKIKIIEDLNDLHKIQKGDVLVTKMTNPDMVVAMQKSSAIVTDEGGLTSHAAIVSREMGIPAIVGTQEATSKLKDGEIITVDGYNGKVYKGKVMEEEQKEILPINEEIQTKTKLKVIVDLPSFAPRAAKSKVKEVGLTRIEGIIAEGGKHPNYFLQNNAEKIKEYEDLIFKGIKGIAQHFQSVWVRTSDIRSDEYSNLEGAPKEKEGNPMLGFHGIRYSLKKPKILEAELKALKRIIDEHPEKKMGLLLPQLISVEEVKKVKEILKEINFEKAQVGVMIETPASVQIIKELCEEGIDFVSFGTNDLTQYTLAIDRNNEDVQYLYNELHPSILHQLKHVIEVCKKYEVVTSICGQAGSKKEMAKFLVEEGITSISVNPDIAKEMQEYIHEIEKKIESHEIKPEPEIEEVNVENQEAINENHLEKEQEVSNEQIPQVKEEKIMDVPEISNDISEETTEEKQETSEENIPEAPKEENKEFEERIEEQKEEINQNNETPTQTNNPEPQQQYQEVNLTPRNQPPENNQEQNQFEKQINETSSETINENQQEQIENQTQNFTENQNTNSPIQQIQNQIKQGMENAEQIAKEIPKEINEENREQEMFDDSDLPPLEPLEETETLAEIQEEIEKQEEGEERKDRKTGTVLDIF